MAAIGRYRVVRRIGRGGMAEVFEAVAEGVGGFSRRVAIKRLLPGTGGHRHLNEMFLDEARIASQLHHGNILGVLDFGVAEGRPFQVIEYIDGNDAGQLDEANPPMPVEVALYICAQVAHALSCAHDATDSGGRPLGIVHRDVKPENILVSWAADVKLGDFGIAFATERTHRTQAGMTKGSYLYMAPEQATRGELDGRTDVFALGCVLHSLVADDSPLAGDGLTDLIAGEQLELSTTLPADVRPIVARATRRSKDDRYDTADEMAADIGTALAARIDGDARPVARAWLDRARPSLEREPQPELADGLIVSGTAHITDSAPRSETGEMATSAVRRAVAGSRWPAIAVISVFLVLAVMGVVIITRDETPAAESAPAADAAAIAIAVAPSQSADGGAADASPAPGAAAARDASIPADARAEPRKQARTRPLPKRVDAGTDRDREQQPPSGDGYLRVGGAGALRAEIRVDGKRRGFAPRLIRLPAGAHDVALYAPDGSRIGSKRIELTQRHTKSKPLSWIARD